MPEIFDASDHRTSDDPQPETETGTSAGKSRSKREVEHYSEVMRAEAPSRNPLDAFAPKPIDIFFDTQAREEKIILLLRQHPITQVKWVVIAVFMALFPLILTQVDFGIFLPSRFQFAAVIFWYVLLIGFMLESFLTWFFNVYIVTDERVIDVDFLSLIYKNITSAKIDNIEDITAETGGAIQSIFNYGTVKIQTAGSITEIEFEKVPQPGKVVRLLNELLLEEEREKVEGRVN